MSSENAASKELIHNRGHLLFNRACGPLGNLSISTKLVAGFGAISIIAVLVGVTGLYFIDKINSTLSNISDVAAPTVETSDNLIALIFEATKVAEEVIADEDIVDIDPLTKELDSLNQRFADTYLELQSLVEDESLLDELETARQEQSEFIDHAVQMVAAHRRRLELETEGFRLLMSFDAVGSELTSALDEFAEENEAQMAKAEEKGDKLEQAGADGAAVNAVLGKLFDKDYPVVEAALKMQRLIIELQDTAGEYLAEQRPGELEMVKGSFLTTYQEVKPHLEVLANLAESEEDIADAAHLEIMLENWVILAHGKGRLFDTHQSMLDAKTLTMVLAERLEADADNVVAALDKVAGTADAISDGADDAAEQAVDQARTTILTLLILALIGSVTLLGLIVLTVVRPIKNLTSAMASLGKGYGPALTPLPRTGDEVDQLRTTFDHLEHQVRQRTAELQQRTSELDEANRDLEQELVQRHTLERQLVHAQKLDSLGTLAGGIAHDFNNMLYVILGSTNIALKELPDGSSLAQLVSRIEKAAHRSKSIVDQILFFSRQEVANRVPIDISLAVEESLTLLRAGLPSTMILNVEIENNCGTVLADKSQIQQLTVNLVTNAYQAHMDRKGTITLNLVQVEINQHFADQHLGLNPGPHVRISVVDQGCGISDEILPKIYDPFFTTRPVGEGTGLGLAVVHGIVKAHEGVTVILTCVDRGTTFEIYFPIYSGVDPAPHVNLESSK
ncbi:ATP-binding protein [Pelagibius sp. Alg239-R121]|uniref:ATP-binding protein n=1 Tax=Pelagibius sp. Alg239-R121 TaxID=2993448 RepID=UPI0024A6D092|nr:ATP-binding protein [Pelagibius sp. Alg239-R121]